MKREELPTPCYIIDMERLKKNLRILSEIEEHTGAKVLLAQKAFSCYPLYPLIGEYVSGTEASGLYEARLGKEAMGKECHVFSAAYREDEFDELLEYADHIVFNSFSQLRKFGKKARAAGKSLGIRVNPECSTGSTPIYDPCAPGSRLGVTREVWEKEADAGLFGLLDGIHFHTLCEQNSDDLVRTLAVVQKNFSDILPYMKWINFGGGHHITRKDYDLKLLYGMIWEMQESHDLTVYLEPGEAFAFNAGWLDTKVLDIVENGKKTAIVDASAACHMPDVIEMPYTPLVIGGGKPGELQYPYTLAGPTCLAGDTIGSYSFDHELEIGERLSFTDMAIYTMVKNNTFNGIRLPSIALREYEKGKEDYRVIREFGYEDFKSRLG